MYRTMPQFGALLVVIGLMTGCASTVKDPISPTPTATVESPSPTPTPSDGPEELSDPELGIVFESAPDLHGDDADVYNLIALFERESWRTKVTGQFSPGFSAIASTEVRLQEQANLDGNVLHGNVFGGVLHVQVGNVIINGDTASGSACRDYADATFTDADGPDTPEQAGFGQPFLMEMTLARTSAADQWIVMTLKENGTC